MGAYLGGSVTETDQSSRLGAHVAMATQPDQILARPGMGVDEGHMIVYNEMARIAALLSRTQPSVQTEPNLIRND